MAEKLIHIFKEILGFLFPSKCLNCGAKNNILCDKCLDFLPEAPASEMRDILAATSYQDEIVKKAIRLFKYHGIKILAEPLAELIFRRLSQSLKNQPSETFIIPIPLSQKRHRERGYNQAELLGHFLSDKLSITMATDVLYKIKETGSQVEIKDREKRLKNLEGAFKIRNAEIIKNKKIILIDDITTTGATLSEAKKVLKQAGAKKVIGLAVAKG